MNQLTLSKEEVRVYCEPKRRQYKDGYNLMINQHKYTKLPSLLWFTFVLLLLGSIQCTDVLGPGKEQIQESLHEVSKEPVRETKTEPQQRRETRTEVNPDASILDASIPDVSIPKEPIPEKIAEIFPQEPVIPEPEKSNEMIQEKTIPEAPRPDWDIKILSFNIRLGVAQDGDNHWNKRKTMVFDVIKNEQADFVGLQESWKYQMDEIQKAVPGYECYGHSRKANTTLDEWSPICYRSSRWTLDPNEKGVLWLSQTPEVPGSQSWSSSLPRIVTWGRFIDKVTQRGIYVFNTHYDHKSQMARFESSKLISRRIAGRLMRKEPVVLMGDFNAHEANDAITFLKGKQINGSQTFAKLIDTYREIHPTEKNAGTFHGWTGRRNGSKIDYIFILEGWIGQKVLESSHIYHQVNNRYPSDHFPVRARLRYGQ